MQADPACIRDGARAKSPRYSLARCRRRMGTLLLNGRTTRSNGLADSPPRKGLRRLVTGGGGYIGCILVE